MSYCNATLHKLIFVLILAYGSVNFSQAGVLGGRNIDDKLIKFDVFLGSKKVGFHTFNFEKVGKELHVKSEANMSFRVFLFKNIKYLHEANEVWQDNCLLKFSSKTIKGDSELSVEGKNFGDKFIVSNLSGENQFSGCVRSFAYWAPELLEAEELLNVENGALVPVKVDKQPNHNESGYSATINLPKSKIDLKYQDDDNWIELETNLKLLGKLRYKKVITKG